MVEVAPTQDPVAASTEEKKQEEPVQKSHPQKSGIDAVTDQHALNVINKVIDKIVRIEVSDGRIYLGKLMAVDQTKTVFI